MVTKLNLINNILSKKNMQKEHILHLHYVLFVLKMEKQMY